ncbi:MAG: site-specific integrase [Nitrosopumilus sp. H8]|nr:MAG: site-specific integrase [Nitrosopumilus sp. H13]RNJ79207.1 MAG: site-specific integrase [Nitrosopumilus sp. H8]
MKVTKEEIQRTVTESPLVLFYQGIKADATRQRYSRMLKLVLCNMFEEILDGDLEQRAVQFVKHGRENPDWTRDLLLILSRKLRDRTGLPREHPEYLNPASIGMYFKPIKKLLDMNDIVISWKRIYATYPELDNVHDTRGWTRQEIQRMLRFSRPMDRAMILVSASSGIRIGGFTGLEWQDLVPIYRTADGALQMERTESQDGAEIVCATLKIYRGTSESYPAFVTPEAYHSIQDYREEWMAQIGREPRQDEPIFIKSGDLQRRATIATVRKHVSTVIARARLRVPGSKISRRYDVPMMNGFRRFWNKACKESLSRDSPLSSLIKKEFMMGHVGLVKLDRNYFKSNIVELAEEYLNAVPNLTIDDAVRLRESNRRKDERIRKLEDEKDTRISDLEEMVRQMATHMKK